jgi:hypothetical protein
MLVHVIFFAKIGNIECYGMWYHWLAFIILPLTLMYPFVLARIARSTSSSFIHIRMAITMPYRHQLHAHSNVHDHDNHDLIIRWAECIQYLRRFVLVILATFLQSPETVQRTCISFI